MADLTRDRPMILCPAGPHRIFVDGLSVRRIHDASSVDAHTSLEELLGMPLPIVEGRRALEIAAPDGRILTLDVRSLKITATGPTQPLPTLLSRWSSWGCLGWVEDEQGIGLELEPSRVLQRTAGET